MNSANKTCSVCNKDFPATLDFFYKHRTTKTGLGSYCKICTKEYRASYFQKNRAKTLELRSIYYRNNLEKVRQSVKEWYKRNQKSVQIKQTISRKHKRKINIRYRLECNLRGRLRSAIKHNARSDRTLNLIGCSTEELKLYLENKFQKGMSWDNYGKWHIDHIRPCASFDLSDPAQQKECFHYSNLQPLWAIDNFKKSDSWDANPNSI
jgi:hypothetical protein